MRRRVFTIIVMVMLALVMAFPAGAITKNWVNDFDHPFVGLVVFYDQEGQFSHRCSGSLLDSTTFLTAGHCTAGVGSARVYFQQDAGANFDPATEIDPITGYPEFCAGATLGVVCATSDELYDFDFAHGGFPDTHDAGLVILDQPIALSEYGQLPTAGVLNDLATARGTKDTIFTVSGYGLTLSQQLHNGKPNTSFRSRLMAESTLVNLGSAFTDGFNLQTQGNGDDRGGTCSGDSGGPVFLGDPNSNLIVGVTSFGLNTICRGTDFAYRVDRTEVLDWINSH